MHCHIHSGHGAQAPIQLRWEGEGTRGDDEHTLMPVCVLVSSPRTNNYSLFPCVPLALLDEPQLSLKSLNTAFLHHKLFENKLCYFTFLRGGAGINVYTLLYLNLLFSVVSDSATL